MEVSKDKTYHFVVACSTDFNLKLSFEPRIYLRVLSPASGAPIVAGEPAVLQVIPSDSSATWTSVEFYANNTSIGVCTNQPFRVSWTTSAVGQYQITSKIVNNSGGTNTSWPTTLQVYPPNDSFDHAEVLNGTSLTFDSSNSFASLEAGEPEHGNMPCDLSVWWSWTAPNDGVVRIALAGHESFQWPLIGAYEGSSVSNLTTLGSGWGSYSSATVFPVRAGRIYHFAVAGGYGSSGAFTFTFSFTAAPANDKFDNSSNLSGSSSVFSGTTDGASVEPGEPNHSWWAQANSVWWHWTAPVSGQVTISCEEAGAWLLLGIYRGSSITNLQSMGGQANSYYHGMRPVTFDAVCGVTYHIAVDGYTGYMSENYFNEYVNGRGPFRFKLELARISLLSPTNGSSFLAPESIELAASPDNVNHSVVQVEFYDGDTMLGTVSSLPYKFIWARPTLGMRKLTARVVDSIGSTNSSAPVLVRIAPANDAFRDRVQLNGAALTITGSISGASSETGEPAHKWYSGTNSVWYSWAAPGEGTATITPTGSDAVLLDVFTGGVFPELARVSETLGSATSFKTSPGQIYQLQVDGGYGWTGDFSLHIAFTPRPAGPANDNFANRIQLTSANQTVYGNNANATLEPGEPRHGPTTAASVWWTWTPPLSGWAVIDTGGGAFLPATAIYTGVELSSLALVASSPETYVTRFPVVAGTPYQIAICGRYHEYFTGPVQFSLRVSPFLVSLIEPGTGSVLTNSTPVTLMANAADNVRFIHFYDGDTLLGAATNRPFAFSWTNPAVGDHLLTAKTTTDAGEIESSAPVKITVRAPEPPTVRILAPLSGEIPEQCLIQNQSEVLNADGRIFSVEFLDGTNLLGSAFAPVFSMVWSNASCGSHQLICKATDQLGSNYTSDPVNLMIRPSNDSFERRKPAYGTSFALPGTNSFASAEPGELLIDGASGKTLWWTWTAPSDALVAISVSADFLQGIRGETSNPNNSFSYGPLVGVFVGGNITNLSLIASNSSRYYPGYGLGEWVVSTNLFFKARAGTNYSIAVDSVNFSAGGFAVHFDANRTEPPLNDDFVDRLAVTGAAVAAAGDNWFASSETGEPGFDPTSGSSVWWTWRAPFSGRVSIDLLTRFAARLGVFEGAGIAHLDPVTIAPQHTSFNARGGVTYQIGVAGVAGAEGIFNWSLALTPAPLNDSFEDRSLLRGTDPEFEGTTVNSTRQAEEPLLPGSVNGASVWYDWVAPVSGTVTLTLVSSAASPVAVFTGPSLGELTLLAAVSDPSETHQLQFYAFAGSAYKIAVADQAGRETTFTARLECPPLLPNLTKASSMSVGHEGFRLVLHGVKGQAYIVQASTNLTDWVTLAMDTMPGDQAEFLDSEAAGNSERFYRVLPLEALFP